ncbi:hypothetical protein LTR62_001795 [Meristemomyces frigidus]|uniref:SET domain-containing protein n=1 Tax=Meristemomyces frigidus TaxID=1508187 RepID=A0AAN7YHW7_9PEZI|nr:hypothetical protein LTR62_001795 [Meristemomyces frigidus]
MAETIESPSIDAIDRAWQQADEAAPELHANSQVPATRRKSKAIQPAHIAPDIVAFYLSGTLHQTKTPDAQSKLEALAQDPAPYKSKQELLHYTQSFTQLSHLLTPPLKPACTTGLCRSLVNAGSHNAFGIRAGGDDAEEYMGYGIWPSASYFNHSCSPNVAKKRVGKEWVFRTAREIGMGEECCITYLGGDEKDLDVRDRRQRLREVWGFECMCLRCLAESRACVDT